MAVVTDQYIPSELRYLWDRALVSADVLGRVKTKKKKGIFRWTVHHKIITALLREGVRMWKTMSQGERDEWEMEGQPYGRSGSAQWLKWFMNSCLTEGEFTVGEFTVQAWGHGASQYISANLPSPMPVDILSIRHRKIVGYSIVGGRSEIR